MSFDGAREVMIFLLEFLLKKSASFECIEYELVRIFWFLNMCRVDGISRLVVFTVQAKINIRRENLICERHSSGLTSRDLLATEGQKGIVAENACSIFGME